MAESPNSNPAFRIVNVRLAFPHLWVPHASMEGGKEKYRAAFLIDPNTPDGKANLKKIKAAIKAAELETFKKSPMVYKNPDRLCLADGDTKIKQATGEVYDGYEGMQVLAASNDRRFPVVDTNPSIPLDKDDGKPYAGCRVNAFLRIYATKDPKLGGNGVFCGLESVQFFKDDEAFGAPPVDPSKVFDDVSDDADDTGSGGDDDDGLDDLE